MCRDDAVTLARSCHVIVLGKVLLKHELQRFLLRIHNKVGFRGGRFCKRKGKIHWTEAYAHPTLGTLELLSQAAPWMKYFHSSFEAYTTPEQKSRASSLRKAEIPVWAIMVFGHPANRMFLKHNTEHQVLDTQGEYRQPRLFNSGFFDNRVSICVEVKNTRNTSNIQIRNINQPQCNTVEEVATFTFRLICSSVSTVICILG